MNEALAQITTQTWCCLTAWVTGTLVYLIMRRSNKKKKLAMPCSNRIIKHRFMLNGRMIQSSRTPINIMIVDEVRKFFIQQVLHEIIRDHLYVLKEDKNYKTDNMEYEIIFSIKENGECNGE